MPNHVQNRITFECEPEQIAEILEQIKHDKYGIGTIDFEKIMPMPPEIYRGDLGQRERDLYGESNWYDWSVANWGTKWNAYEFPERPYQMGEPLCFLTAWTPPHPILEKLSQMFPGIEITHEWADEDYGQNCGRRCYLGGDCTEDWVPGFEEDAVKFACKIWGTSPEEEGLLQDEPDLTES